MEMIRFEYPCLPTSVNALYMLRGGRKVMTSAGRKFKNGFTTAMGGANQVDFLAFQVNNEQEYELELWFYIHPDNLYNMTYGTDGRVKSPFKDIDASNLIKLVEDCVASLVGLRDRNNFDVLAHKRPADEKGERVVAYLRPSTLKEDPHEGQ